MPRGTVLQKQHSSKLWCHLFRVVAPPGRKNIPVPGGAAQWGLSTICVRPSPVLHSLSPTLECVSPVSGRLCVEIATARRHGASVARGPPGETCLSAMGDQVDVGLVHLIGLQHREEHLVRVIGSGFSGNQPDPLGDPFDVAVHRHQRRAEREEQHDRCGLPADPWNGRHPCPGLEGFEPIKEIERVIAVPLPQ